MSFISFFATVSSEPLNNVKGFILILLLTRLDPASETAFGMLSALLTFSAILENSEIAFIDDPKKTNQGKSMYPHHHRQLSFL